MRRSKRPLLDRCLALWERRQLLLRCAVSLGLLLAALAARRPSGAAPGSKKN